MSSFGLIGRHLSHSFSADYFARKFASKGVQHTYKNFEFDTIQSIKDFLEHTTDLGFNVTLPYKTEIIPLLQGLSAEAQSIGAVNTLKKEAHGWMGYNTDIFGFEQSLKELPGEIPPFALIFGNGGAARAIKFVLHKNGISFLTVSRSDGDLTFPQLLKSEISRKHRFWINTTPVGQYNYPEQLLPLPYEILDSNYLLFDLIYNPDITPFLAEGKLRKSTVVNGLRMLELQAEKSFQIWTKE
jgi:shikimate dehydrogenase